MSIKLENLTKRFGSQTVVKHVSLEIAEGELFVLVGASGSGKSTVLRMIAGLTICDEGSVSINGKDVTHLAPQPRGTGFVFQNYSIFRHMTLAQNIEFGLKIRKVPRAERAKRRDELLELVGLTGFGDRYPSQISGGQQQRVALARALAYEPAVLLLDEPLGALDVKIRVQLRRSLKEIQSRLRVTTLLVTHDQEEAYELADRIGIMERGTLLEVGAPEELYARPKTLYVAGFLGGGTVLAGRVADGQARFGTIALPIPADVPHEDGASVELLFRPEHVTLSADEPKADRPVLGKGRIVEQTFSGATRRLRLRLPRLPGTRQITPVVPFGEDSFAVETIVPANFPVQARDFWVRIESWTILQQAPPSLLVIDAGSGSSEPLQLARTISNNMRASVKLLGFAPNSVPDQLRAAVHRRAHDVGLVDATIHTGFGSLPQQIAAQSANALFEMLILPSSLEVSKSRLDQQVISFLEDVDLPVLIVGPNAKMKISRILICTRAGEPGKSDIRIGGRLARHLGASVSLLHITPSQPGATPQQRRHLEQAAATLAGLEVPNEILIRTNYNAAEGILKEAAEHDLTVVGGHGPQVRSAFARDDITLQVLARARCPVLVVPAEE